MKPRRARRRIARALHALMTVVYLPVAAAAGAFAAAPHLGWAEYHVDLAAQFSAQAALITIPLLLWWMLMRRWGFALFAAAALASHGLVLLAPRAAWAEPTDQAAGTTVRVLQFNAYSRNHRVDEAVAMILESDADLVSLMEPGFAIINRGFRQEMFRGAYPWFDQHVPGEYLGWQYLLSRWPIHRFEEPLPERPQPDTWNNRQASIVMALVVRRPAAAGGHFGIVTLHPPSPRDGRRWQEGNQLVADTVGTIQRMRAAGLPVVVLADLNSTPSGWRDQLLRRQAEVRRAKPLLRMEGTYPAYWPWPKRLAIDDVWVSDDVRVTAWRTAGPAGSDHMAVIADLLVPGRSAPETSGEPEEPPETGDPYEQRGLGP